VRYLINVTFLNNVAGSGKGNDFSDNSTSALTAYTRSSVVNCTSTSSSIKFYGANNNIIFDCLFSGNCPTNYFYISLSGTDFPFCGSIDSPCLTLVYGIFFILRKIFFYIYL
jgi:hypothetical protein